MGNFFSLAFKKTKIVATLGPSSHTPEIIQKLIHHGLNVARLNFSHGTHADHSKNIEIIRKLEKEQHTHIAIIQDLQGPKIRLGNLSEETHILEKDTIVTLTHAQSQDGDTIPIQYNIFPHLQEGHTIFINDGIIKLKVIKTTTTTADCLVIAGGEIKSHKGVNLPDTIIPIGALTEKDKADLHMGIAEKVDYVAISFVQTPKDILLLRNLIATYHHKPKIIVKIETKAAIKNLEDIIKTTDAVMIARGDLAVEVGQEEVPLLQRTIIRLSRTHNKPVIVATQMLESMIHSVEPTRAEVNDVATAVLDQVDCVMLSGETASGQYPVETVSMMNKIIVHVEKAYAQIEKEPHHTSGEDIHEQTVAIAAAASLLAHQIKATNIFALTATGNTPLRISSYRPRAPIIALTDTVVVAQQLTLVWGVTPYFMPKIKDNDRAYKELVKNLLDKGEIKKDDRIVLVTSQHPGVTGGTNIISVTRIGQIH